MKYLILPLVAVLLCSCAPRTATAAFDLKYPHQVVPQASGQAVIAVDRADMDRLARVSGLSPLAMDVSCPAHGFISREPADPMLFGPAWALRPGKVIWWKCSDPAHPTAGETGALAEALDRVAALK